ncbi:protein NLP3-like [Cornus florida]|uniref:protein NLP3-like n=1 Tax=Cornus florida TaxID=4283 RepID=UPI0028A068EE|nr:protein NLP3-like [Cornus florida]
MPEPRVNPNCDDDEEEDETSDPYDDEEEDETSDLDNDDEEDERKIMNFMKDLPIEVFYQCPSLKKMLWAFWSEPTLSPCSVGSITDSATHTPTTNQPIITDIIKSALLDYNGIFYGDEDVLIQFWAPIRTETGCVQLVTSDQPFGLSYDLDERLLKYRKQCLQYKFNVDGEEVEGLGIPGRVFRQKWPEHLPDVRHYSTKEYPQRDITLACDIEASFCFPLFQTSFQECVGVLEFATTTNSVLYWTCKSFIQLAGLKSSLCCGYDFISKVDYPDEIYKGLRVVCETHDLPLAKTWIPCGHFNGLAFDGNLDNSYDTFDVSCMGPAFHCHLGASYFIDEDLEGFFYDRNVFQRGHRIVGSAYQSHKLCFCRDITQFSITEYPSMPIARSLGLTGCFAICLQTTFSNNYYYIIIEFFLNPKNTYGEDQGAFLCPILETMKQNFPSFKLASGEELGKELSIEVIKPRMNQEPTSFQCQSTSSPSNRPGVLQNGQEMMQPHSSNQQIFEVDDIDNRWNLVDAAQNSIPVSCSDEARMNQELATFQSQSTRSPLGIGVLHDGQETLQPHSLIQQPTDEVEVDINSGRNVDAEQNNTPGSSSNGEHPTFSHEELKKYFGMPRKVVAQKFKMSESTFKRRLGEIGLKWPYVRGKQKFKGSTFRQDPPCSDAHMTPLVRPPVKRKKVNDPPSRQDPPSSDLPARTTPVVTPPPEARKMTIKATYKGSTVKFELPLTSGMTQLEEKVSKRFKLDVGTYNITYNDGEEQITIPCDEDLQYCMNAFNLSGKDTIRMLIEPK